MADEILDPEQIKKATEALEEYAQSLREFNQIADPKQIIDEIDQRSELNKLLSIEFEERQKIITSKQQEIQTQIESLNALADDKKFSDFQKKKLEMLKDEQQALQSIRDTNNASSAEIAANNEKVASSLGDLAQSAAGAEEGISSLGGAAAALGLGVTGAVMLKDAFLGLRSALNPSNIINFVIALDDSRRAMQPFLGSIEHAAETHKELALAARDAIIPIEDLHGIVTEASDAFSLLSKEQPEVIAQLAVLEGQMRRLGGTGTTRILESLITEGGMDSVDAATNRIKALTIQMKDLGVTPKQFTESFVNLIPNLALFGSQADNMIAKITLAAQKSKIGTEAITGVAEQFSTYSGAAQAIQGINAIFGEPLFTDPAALVDLFYSEGPEGILKALQDKLAGGLDPETPAGRAQIKALQQILGGLGDSQTILRAFDPDAQVAEDQREALVQEPTGDEQARLIGDFDALNKSTASLKDQAAAAAQELALTAARAAELDLTRLSTMAEKTIELAELALAPKAEELGAEIAPGVNEFEKTLDFLLGGAKLGLGVDIEEALEKMGVTPASLPGVPAGTGRDGTLLDLMGTGAVNLFGATPTAEFAMSRAGFTGELGVLDIALNSDEIKAEVTKAIEENRFDFTTNQVIYRSELGGEVRADLGEIEDLLDEPLLFGESELKERLRMADEAEEKRRASEAQTGAVQTSAAQTEAIQASAAQTQAIQANSVEAQRALAAPFLPPASLMPSPPAESNEPVPVNIFLDSSGRKSLSGFMQSSALDAINREGDTRRGFRPQAVNPSDVIR